jgi:hypothetical protein
MSEVLPGKLPQLDGDPVSLETAPRMLWISPRGYQCIVATVPNSSGMEGGEGLGFWLDCVLVW